MVTQMHHERPKAGPTIGPKQETKESKAAEELALDLKCSQRSEDNRVKLIQGPSNSAMNLDPQYLSQEAFEKPHQTVKEIVSVFNKQRGLPLKLDQTKFALPVEELQSDNNLFQVVSQSSDFSYKVTLPHAKYESKNVEHWLEHPDYPNGYKEEHHEVMEMILEVKNPIRGQSDFYVVNYNIQ